MTDKDIRATVLAILEQLAPEADMSLLRPDVRLRDQLDLDSMDFLNFLIAVDAEMNVDIPEADYPRLRTLDDIVAYIEAKLLQAGGDSSVRMACRNRTFGTDRRLGKVLPSSRAAAVVGLMLLAPEERAGAGTAEP